MTKPNIGRFSSLVKPEQPIVPIRPIKPLPNQRTLAGFFPEDRAPGTIPGVVPSRPSLTEPDKKGSKADYQLAWDKIAEKQAAMVNSAWDRTLSIEAEPAGASIEAQVDVSPAFSNTGDTKRQIENAALDWLEAGVYGAFDEGVQEKLVKELAGLKEQAGGGKNAFLVRGPLTLRVAQSGAQFGITYKFALQYRGCTIWFLHKPVTNFADVRFRIPGEACLLGGAKQLYEEILAILARLGLNVVRVCPSRVDACVELPGVDIMEFVGPYLARHVVQQAKYDNPWRVSGEYTGFTIGRGCVLNAYDRYARAKQDETVFAAMCAFRWGGDPGKAARIEIQMGRDELGGRWNVMTMEQLWEQLPAMVKYYTEEWFRMTDGEPDRKNHNVARSKMSPLWQRVCKLFADGFGQIVELLDRRLEEMPESDRLKKMGLGCFASLAAKAGYDLKSRENVEDFFLRVVQENWFAFKTKTARRLKHFDAIRCRPKVVELFAT